MHVVVQIQELFSGASVEGGGRVRDHSVCTTYCLLAAVNITSVLPIGHLVL